jgi:uncharacterized protein YycO
LITLQFVQGRDLSSKAISWFSAGHLSHVDAVMSNGKLLGARSDKVGGAPPGVQIRYPDYAPWNSVIRLTFSPSDTDEKIFWAFLLKQLGKPYDSTAIWGFVTGRNWREEDSWFCSELQARALEISGICPPLCTPTDKITPVALAMIASALGAKP